MFSTAVLSALFVRILEKEGTGLSNEQVLNKAIKRMNDCNITTDDNNKLALNRRITDIKNILVGIGMVCEFKTSSMQYKREYFYAHDDPKELKNVQIRIQNLQHKLNQLRENWKQLHTHQIQAQLQNAGDTSLISCVQEIKRRKITNDVCLPGKSKYEDESEDLETGGTPTRLIPTYIKSSYLNECKMLDSFTICNFEQESL